MNYLIRRIKKEDVYEVAHIVTISWNETYKGIVSDDELSKLKENENERALKSYNNFKDNTFVLEVDNKIVGFTTYKMTNYNDYHDAGELQALYIVKEYQKYGFGKILVNRVKEELKSMGFNKMIICCLKGNPSNEFYKHIGGVYIKDGLYERLNLKENIYLFNI